MRHCFNKVWRASSENEVIPFTSEAETESGNVVIPNLKITGNISKADKIKEECGVEKVIIGMLSPTIGTHAGPGTVGLFFIGENK